MKITGKPDDAQWEEALGVLRQTLEDAPEPGLYVIDVLRLEGLSATQRAKMGEWRTRHGALQREKVRAVAYLVRNPIVRGVFTATFWIRRPPFPVRFLEDELEAERWLLEQ